MKIFEGSKVIWQYLSQYKKRMYFITLIAILGSFINAVIPYIYGRLVDIAVSGFSNNLQLIIGILFIWLVLSLLGDWLSRASNFKGSFLGVDAANDLIVKITSHIIDLPISFHKDRKMGEINRRISRGASYLENIIGNTIFYLLPSFLTIITAFGIMFWVEWRLAGVLLVILLFYSLITIWKTNPIVREHKKLNKIFEKSYGDLFDSISNVYLIKSFTQENTEKKKIYRNFRTKVSQGTKNFYNFWRALDAWQETIFSIGFVGVFAAAILMLRSDMITAGQLVMFIGYVSLAYSPFSSLGGQYKQLRSGLTAIERAENIMKKDIETSQKRKVELKDIRGEVEFKSVSFVYYKKQEVLSDINFKVKPGQMIALVGESGVGKTTLVDLISGFYLPQKGRILIDGQDISKTTLKSLRENIAIVPQEITLFNDTVKKNIGYGNDEASDEEIIEAAKIAYAHKFIQKFPKKYNQLVGERGIKLSTGQKQRVAIARAILKDPKILILDEATSSLDTATEKLVQKAVNHLIKGRTTFVIAHRLSTVQKADQIIVLEKGRIIEEGDHQELISKGGVYKKLCQLQTTVIK